MAFTLTLGASAVSCAVLGLNSVSLTLTANTSTITCSGNFGGGGKTYNDVEIDANSTIAGSNTYATLTLSGTADVVFTSSTTQTCTTFTNTSSGTVTATGSTISCGGSFSGNGKTYVTVNITDTATIAGANTFTTLTLSANKTYTITNGITQTCTTFTSNGTSGNTITLVSASPGTAYTISATTANLAYCDITDFTAAGAGSPFTVAVASTNRGNNTNLTFAGSPTTYTLTRDKAAAYAANTNPIWKKGAAVVNYGASGDGGIFMSASESNAPYIAVFDHAGSPWTTTTTRLRLGNLNGYLGYSADTYGLGVGSSASTDANITLDATNGFRIRKGTTDIITFANTGVATFANAIVMGALGTISSGQTAYDTGTGYWLEGNSGTPRFSIGNSSTNKMLWNGTSLQVVGNIENVGGDGTDGALTLTSAAVENISTNTVMNYAGISITGTAKLATTDTQVGAFLLKSRGNVTISSANGITANGLALTDATTNFLFGATATQITFDGANEAGGAGGDGATQAAGAGGSGGVQGGGFGGGGGGGAGVGVSGGDGGDGGTGGTPVGSGGTGGFSAGSGDDGGDGGTSAGGGGGSAAAGETGGVGGGGAYGANGANGTTVNEGGGGGASGEAGYGGHAVFIEADGNVDLSGGTINTSGSAASNGGTGAGTNSGGGGGGGGGGGNAQDVHIIYTGTYTSGTITMSAGAKGTGGAAGSGGAPSAGSDGTVGNAGASTISKIIL